MQIYRPDGDVARDDVDLAPSPASLAGVRIAVLDNGKPNAVLVMQRAAEAVAARTGATVALVTKKGPRGLSANAAIPVAEDIFERLLAEADVVITGAADCGSCTAYSVSDTVALERAGKPTVLLTTTRFEPIADTLAANTGLPSIRKLVLEHPIGGVDAATLTARAEAAAGVVEALLLGSARPATAALPPVSPPASPPAVSDGHVDAALASLRTIVQADGGDLVVDSVVGSTVALRLVLSDAECAECVMPRSYLEELALDVLGRTVPGVAAVTIDDPRDHT